MKKYVNKVMTKEHSDEIDALWNDGHAEALAAFALEAVEAYKSGERTGGVIGICAIVAVVGIGVTAEIVTRRLSKKRDEKETDA